MRRTSERGQRRIPATGSGGGARARTAAPGGATTSLWVATAETPRHPRLDRSLASEVCVVGGGIAGLTAAYLLACEGKAVVVVDDGPVGGGETGRTTAHLSCEIDDTYVEIERLHGERGARLAYESHAHAIDRIESIVSSEGIDCDFERVDGYLFLSPEESEEFLREELAAAHRAGFREVFRESSLRPGGRELGPSLRFPRQAQIHALRYLAGLAAALERRGGRIFSGTRISAVESESGKAIARTATGHEIRADHLVVATNTPVVDRFSIHTKQAAYRTYAIAAPVRSGEIRRGLYWDTSDPYHYVRLQPESGRDLVVIGGEDHKTGHRSEPEERFAALEAWARERFPAIGPVEYRWSGQVMETVDGLGFIGRNPADEPNVYVATGDSGMGMTHGTIAGVIVCDLICGRENPWAALYDPSRMTLRAAKRWLAENLDVAYQATSLVTPGEVSSTDEIEAGSGAVIRRGLAKIAAYRDELGRLHERSALCPHLGCVVAWNALEKSWDCPCHGSRFDPRGEVLNGPAARRLGEVE